MPHSQHPHHHHHPGREPSTTSASSSTSSKTSQSATKVTRAGINPDDLFYNIQPHGQHLHYHPRYGYIYPPIVNRVPGPGGSSVILLRNQSPRAVRRSKVVAMPQHPQAYRGTGGLKVVPLNARRGVSVEPVLVQRRNSGSSGRSNDSKTTATSYIPKLATPTISFGDKMAGLKEVSTLKFFSPKKLSQEKAGDLTILASEGDASQGIPVRKNSSDTLRSAITHSKAAFKKGIKIGATGLNELKKHVHHTTPQDVCLENPNEKLSIDKIGYGFTNEEAAILFGLDLNDHQVPEGDQKPDISVFSLSSYTQIDPSLVSKPLSDSFRAEPERSSSEPLLNTESRLTCESDMIANIIDPAGILKHSSPTDKNFKADFPTSRDELKPLPSDKGIRRVVTFSMPTGSKWKASQSSLSISTPDLRSLQQSSIDEDDQPIVDNQGLGQVHLNQQTLPAEVINENMAFLIGQSDPYEEHLAADQDTTLMTTTEILMRAQALLSSNPEQNQTEGDDSSDCQTCAMAKSSNGRQRSKGKRKSQNSVNFEIGSPNSHFQDTLTSRLRDMSVSDLTNQREIFTRQIATTLVALNQVNYELDRRRRRKSHSIKQKDSKSLTEKDYSLKKASQRDSGCKIPDNYYDAEVHVEPAKPVLKKSISFPYLCERPLRRSDEDEAYNNPDLDDACQFMDQLWNDFVNSPETDIGAT